MSSPDRLTAIDLSTLSEDEHAALRRAAIGADLPFSEYLGKLIAAKSVQLLNSSDRRPALTR